MSWKHRVVRHPQAERDIEVLAQVELEDQLRRLAEPSPFEAAFAEITQVDKLQRSLARALEPFSVADGIDELSRVAAAERSLLAELTAPSAIEATLAEVTRGPR